MTLERPALRAGRRLAVLFGAALLVACQATPTPLPTTGPLPTAAVSANGTPVAPTPIAPAPTPTRPAPQIVYLGPAPLPQALADTAAELGLSAGVHEPGSGLSGAQVVIAPDAESLTQAGSIGSAYTIVLDGGAAPEGGLALDQSQARWDQAGFLLGLAAGWATEARQIGVVSAGSDARTLAYRNGFLSGVRYSCATCLIDQFDLPELSDAAIAASQGAQFSTYGSDVIFVAPAPAAGAMLQALAQNRIVVLADGADMSAAFGPDRNAWPETALVDVGVDPAIGLAQALRQFAAGTPLTGVQPMSIETGAVALGPWHDPRGLITPLDQRDIDTARGRVASGALDVGVDPVTGQPK
ncbi:MAG: BMP family ABC transporter substrate-binding protein [Anaerolineales bacterium]|nr:BMP family ABC transporter substrate-binding protein [Anaerolineales bacterium]